VCKIAVRNPFIKDLFVFFAKIYDIQLKKARSGGIFSPEPSLLNSKGYDL
jgi:hypothetical protein